MKLRTALRSALLSALLLAACKETAAPTASPVAPGPATAMPAGHPGAAMPPHGGLGAPSPHGAGGPTSMPAGHGAAGMPPHGAGGPTAGPGALPPGHPAVAPGDVRGAVRLDARLAADVKPGSTLFVMARRDAPAGQKGMLLAAKKVPVTGAAMFPYAYVLTQDNVMMQGTALDGIVRVSARIDQDGDALSKVPGDVEGVCPAPASVGSSGVDLTLDSKL